MIKRFERIEQLLSDAETLHERLKILTADVIDDGRRGNAINGSSCTTATDADVDYDETDENFCPANILEDELAKPSKPLSITDHLYLFTNFLVQM